LFNIKILQTIPKYRSGVPFCVVYIYTRIRNCTLHVKG